jgi:hypothetical protein
VPHAPLPSIVKFHECVNQHQACGALGSERDLSGLRTFLGDAKLLAMRKTLIGG